MYKIVIVTTYGCEACKIAENNVNQAVAQTDKEIEVEVKDWKDVGRSVLVLHNIKDYPAVLYYVGDNIVTSSVGTYPSPVYLRWIDMYFKY